DWNLWKFAAGGRAAPVDFASSTMFDGAPAFSPDSRRVAFASDRDGNGRQIWVANADGSGPVALTPATGRVQGSPQWSPDGQWIVYDGQASDGHQDIYVVAASGGTPRRVTQNVSSAFRPSWSHAGAWIYFSSTQAGTS